MAFYLRRITKARWLRPDEKWLPDGEVHADPIVDLRTEKNELSVWSVDDSRANFDRVVTALGGTGEFVSNVDYALVEDRLIKELGIRVQQSAGATPDDQANESWHYHLTELTGAKILQLALLIAFRSERDRVRERAMRTLLLDAISAGTIARDRLDENLARRLA
ncbi:MAG: hypothetical protein ACYS0K_08885 [Planctomycetota bacterium]|jgi:hypothetical protein